MAALLELEQQAVLAKTFEYSVLASELARRNSARRKNLRGAPRVPTPCVRCGEPCPTAREARAHCSVPAAPRDPETDVLLELARSASLLATKRVLAQGSSRRSASGDRK